jgi:hypothetical protein
MNAHIDALVSKFPEIALEIATYKKRAMVRRNNENSYPSDWVRRHDDKYYPPSFKRRHDGNYYPADWKRGSDGKYYPPKSTKTKSNATSNTNEKLVSKKDCWKCGGIGYFPKYSHIEYGVCFLCRNDGEPVPTYSISKEKGKSRSWSYKDFCSEDITGGSMSFNKWFEIK